MAVYDTSDNKKTFDNFYKSLHSNGLRKKIEDISGKNIVFSDLLKESLDCLLGNPKNDNDDYVVTDIIIFDIEFYNNIFLNNEFAKDKGYKGQVTYSYRIDENSTQKLDKLYINTKYVRELAFIVLSKHNSGHWYLKYKCSVDINHVIFNNILNSYGDNWRCTPNSLLDSKFCSVSDVTKKIIDNKSNYTVDKIKELKTEFSNILQKYAVDEKVIKRIIGNNELLDLLHFFNNKKKIAFVNKGNGDLEALYNTFILLGGKKIVNKVEITNDVFNLKNRYDMEQYNGLFYTKLTNATLSDNKDELFKNTLYHIVNNLHKDDIGKFLGYVNSLYNGFIPKKGSISNDAHDPMYDTFCTLFICIIINCGNLIMLGDIEEYLKYNQITGLVFARLKKYCQSNIYHAKKKQNSNDSIIGKLKIKDEFVILGSDPKSKSIKEGGDLDTIQERDIYYKKYLKYKQKYLNKK
jgi:hypothetical protein